MRKICPQFEAQKRRHNGFISSILGEKMWAKMSKIAAHEFRKRSNA
ncbi:MAG: hypothetical protein LBT01_05560 [Spirochaetaceae bacterium]|nr:hypothetical protein [Spirochaetaceae bacterium]